LRCIKDEWEEHNEKDTIIGLACAGFILAFACYAGPFDDVCLRVPKFLQIGSGGPDEATTASGLKEALSIGSGNAVTSVSKFRYPGKAGGLLKP